MTSDASARSVEQPAQVDSSVARSARVYNYLLGGSDNFAIDRDAAQEAATLRGGWDQATAGPRAQRALLARVVRYLTEEAGIGQFLDIGCGIPAGDHTHELAQQVVPDARVVYVDRDPVVAVHMGPLVASAPEGTAAYVEADLHDPARLLEQVGAELDLSRPVAVMMFGVLHHFEDEEDPWGVVAQLVEGVPSGSHIVISQLAKDLRKEMARVAEHYNDVLAEPMVPRTHEEFTRYFEGLELVEPGVVPSQQWRPDDPEAAASQLGTAYAAVARKP